MILGLVSVQAASATPAAAVGAAVLTGLGMMAGVWLVRAFEGWAIRRSAQLIAFASGLLVAGALLHLIARAVSLIGELALSWALLSFLALYLVEAHFVPHVHSRGESPIDTPASTSHLAPIVLVGLGLHSIVDGISVGAGLSAGSLLGAVALTLVVVHKLPVGIAAISVLYHSGIRGRRAIWLSTALALVTPVVTLASYFVLRRVTDPLLGTLLALAGGSFLYVGAADLLPEGQARGRLASTLAFSAGLALMVGVKLLG